jgi:hypothetical protein
MQKRPRRSRGPLTVGFLFTLVWDEMQRTFVVSRWHGVGMGGAEIARGLNSVRENSVVPPGLARFFLPFPALKRWAIIGCPSGA